MLEGGHGKGATLPDNCDAVYTQGLHVLSLRIAFYAHILYPRICISRSQDVSSMWWFAPVQNEYKNAFHRLAGR